MKIGIKSLRFSLAIVVLSLASISYAQVDTTPNDSWGTDGGPGSPALSSPAKAFATLGSHVLEADNPQGSFWGPATFNLVGSSTYRTALQTATTLSLDLTLNNSDINGGAPGFNGFAQSNELAITLFAPTGGPSGGLNFFIQENWGAAGISDSSGQSAGWNGVDGTRTLVWDLTKFTATDPNTRSAKTVGQFLATYPDISDAKIAFVEQTGGGTATVGPAAFFFDNVKLIDASSNATVIGDFEPVPEPGSLVLLGLAIPGLFVARRYRKSIQK